MDRKQDRPPTPDQAARRGTPPAAPRLTPDAAAAQAARRQRLAAALRANLHRRKAAARGTD